MMNFTTRNHYFRLAHFVFCMRIRSYLSGFSNMRILRTGKIEHMAELNPV